MLQPIQNDDPAVLQLHRNLSIKSVTCPPVEDTADEEMEMNGLVHLLSEHEV
jgi:hypothetical protein